MGKHGCVSTRKRQPPAGNKPAAKSQRPHTRAPQQARGHKPSQKAIRDRQAAQRALAEASGARAARRRRLLSVLGPIGAVLLVVAVLVVVKLAGDSGTPKSGDRASAAAAAVIQDLTGVPAATFDAVGVGTSKPAPKPINDELALQDGKPRVLYIGAEYCPYCAAERWPMIVALSRFGTWSGLKQSSSPPAPEAFPNTATFTFHGSSYASDVLSFTGVETQSNQVVDGKFAPLDTLTKADADIMSRHNETGGIPFVYLGGKYVLNGATFDPGVLAGKTHEQIAAALADPKSDVAKGVDGAANSITAAVCKLTGEKPAAVCTSPGVVKAAQAMKTTG